MSNELYADNMLEKIESGSGYTFRVNKDYDAVWMSQEQLATFFDVSLKSPNEIKKYGSKVVYETLILGLLKITIESSLNNIQNNNVLIGDYNYIINSVSEDGNILHNFDFL